MNEASVSSKRFRQIEVLGQGGMGKVLKCEDTLLKRTVAMKVLLYDTDENLIKRFQKEAQATARLNHPNIIQILDFGAFDDGKLFITMEYLEGVGLDKLIEQEKCLEIFAMLEIIEQICLGLEHAHGNDILHRDIKPSNVMLLKDTQDEPRVKLVDFGIARYRIADEQRLTESGLIVGSPLYMSPGTATAEDADESSEIYALGCLIFEVLTGDTPFRGNNAMDTLLMHKEDTPPTLAERTEQDFPDELEAIVAKCLEKERENRFHSVEELRHALYNFQDNYENRLAKRSNRQDEDSSILPDQKRPTVRRIVYFIVIALFLILLAVSTFNSKTSRNSVEEKQRLKHLAARDQIAKYRYRDIKHVPFSRMHRNNTWIWFNGYNDKLTDRDFRFLVGKKPLGIRVESCKQVTGTGLKYLREWPIEYLDFTNCGLTSEGIKEIAGFKSLRELDLGQTPVSDADLKILRSNQLETLTLDRSLGVTDTGFKRLPSYFPNLKGLSISYTGVSPDTFKSLAELMKLESIYLSGLNLTDEDLKPLARCPLTNITLFDNPDLSDRCLEVFERFGSLEDLILDTKSKMSVSGLKDFKRRYRRKSPRFIIRVQIEEFAGKSDFREIGKFKTDSLKKERHVEE